MNNNDKRAWIEMTQGWIFKKGSNVLSTIVECIIAPMSLVLT